MRRSALFLLLIAAIGSSVVWWSIRVTPQLTPDFIQNPEHNHWNRIDPFSELPHVDSCSRCDICHVPVYDSSVEFFERRYTRSLSWPKVTTEPRLKSVYDKSNYPYCAECWGCHQIIEEMHQQSNEFNIDEFEMPTGESEGDVYLIKDPNLSHETFVVKLWCIQSSTNDEQCDEEDMTNAIQIALGVQKIVDECGFREIVSNVWIAPINAVLPLTGDHINWDGLWSEKAKGIPLASFIDDSISNGMNPSEFEHFINHKLNSTEILMAAVLDLLSCQADRHSENVFISDNGHITLIDNDEALGHAWRRVGADSIFLPTTQYHTRQHIGSRYVRKKTNKPRRNPLASVVLDYRCHAPDGRIGTNYPPAAKTTMERIQTMTAEVVQTYYNLPDIESAKLLKIRSSDMLNKGFEWTLEHGAPLNAPSLKYPWHPPCCRIRVIPGTSEVECADPSYRRDFTRPPGDPVDGE